MGPIDVYLVSQFEEKFEEVNGVEPSTSFPVASSSGSNENAATEMTPVVSSRVEFEPPARYSHRMSSEPNVSQDNAGGIMRIVPSDINFENEVDLSDSDDDFKLLHEAGQRLLACNLAKDLPLFVKPLTTLPPALSDEDDEDDFEMCRAVVKRCAPYLQDKLKVEEDEGETVEGDAVNDEDEEDEQYDERGKDKAISDEKSQKTKKRESEKHYELDEDDYELLSDNNVKGFRRQKPSKTFKRLKKAQRDTEGEHSLFSGPSLEDIVEEEEQAEEEEDEMADFIVYEEEEDDKIPGRRKSLNEKCRRQQEFCATFGCSTLHQRESDNSTERSKKLKIDDVLEPIVLSRKYMTDKDILIRARDIPERQQISEEASGTPPTDEMSKYDECNWIFNQLKTGKSATGKRELVIEKEHIQEFINLIRFQKLDIPFIASRWKLMYPSLFEVPDQHEVDSDYPSKADKKRGLTRHMVVWDIHDLDTEWLLLQLQKSALQSNKRFKEESCRVHDETYRTSTDQLFESITKSLKDAESEREVEDVELKFYLHFPEVDVGERKCKRLPNRRKEYKVCREAGLGAVADKFGFRLGQFGLQDELKYPKEAPEVVAIDFISTGFETSQAVLEGARHMAAVQICSEPCVRKKVRSIFMDKAIVSTCPTRKGHAAIDTLHQFAGVKWLRDKPLTRFEDAQWLLIQKAEEQNFLRVTVKLPDSVSDKLIADSSFYYLSDGAQLWNEQRKMIVQAAFVHFLLPSMEKEARSLLARRAKNWLRNEYGKRLWDEVSVAPYKRKQNSEDAALKVMACCWWPGERGTTFVMLNSFGELVDTLDAMYFSVSSQNFDDQQHKMNDVQPIVKFMTDHKPHVIVLGGVNLSCTWFKQYIDRIISLAVLDNPRVDIIYGDGDLPRLYENSRISVDQLPGHSGSVKRAVALGRVQLNPLAMFASLCGHDRDILFWKRSPLDSFLTDDEKYGMVEQVMVDVTSQVGLDVTSAIAHEWLFSPLQFISGLGPSKASSLQKSLVRSRSIGNRKDLLTAHGLGKKVLQNSIEFLSMQHTSFGCRRRQSQEDIFYMIPGVTVDTIAEGRILQATVKRVVHQRAYCELELGLSRLTGVLIKKDRTCVWNKLHSGDTLTCRIKSIQFDTYQVSLTCVKNDILSDRYKNHRTMDPFYHENHSSLQSDREKDHKERETAKKRFLHRMSSHPMFENITLDEAMECLSKEEIGRFFFCPSPHGPLFLALILKVHDGVFAHKVIVEEGKINDALSLIRKIKALRIGASTFEDLDEIMDRYVDNYMNKFKLMLSYRKFMEGNQAKIDEVLRVEKSESPKKIVYCFGISFDDPGSFILTYIRSTIPHHECIQVYPEGFKFRNKMFEDIVSLVNYVHSCIQSVVAGGSSGKTIYIGNLPSDISDEQLEEVLKQFGPIEKAGIQTTKRSDGFCFGFVEFVLYRDARSAVKARKVMIGSNEACMKEKASMKKKGPSNQGKWRRSSEGVPKWGWKHLRISDTAASLK